MTARSLEEDLRQLGAEHGLDAVGFCTAERFDDVRAVLEQRKADGLSADMNFTYRNPSRSTDPTRTLPAARSIVVAAHSFRRRASHPEGTVARVGEYVWEPHYAHLRAGLDVVADRLRDRGHRAVVLVDDNALVDRAAAHRAGLGWWGKNSNILLVGKGSRFVLGSILTDAELTPDLTVDDQCGPCTKCIDACPTDAIVDGRAVDARKCLAWLVQSPGAFPREYRAALGDRLYGCDDCQDVCPPNRVLDRNDPATSTTGDAFVDILDLLESSDDELLERHGAWYIPRRDPAYLRRNALIVLGNTGDGRAPRAADVLVSALADDRAVVAAHALWASRRLGREDLAAAAIDAWGDEPDPMLADEIAAVGV